MDNYEKIYFENYYEIDDNFTFSLKDFNKVKNNSLFKKDFAVITAFNPQNELLSCIKNQDRHILFRKDIESKKLEFLDARGYLDDHSEDGYLIFNISFENSIKLALKYEQYAIFYNHCQTKKIGYYMCSSKLPIIEKTY
ncbi:DUF3293 domain-containing protein [Arcobacter sp. YIC-464]|uniref:DUF3293 domain-containing protein n=1 Tax=Arcobacter sp. YIC-464 TaxID=3376631 RepID=UPI003C14E6A5